MDRYFEDHPHLRPGTLAVYRRATRKLEAWSGRAGVRSADDLNGPRLVALRASLVKDPKHNPSQGGKRGRKDASRERRKPAAVNVDLRAIKTVLCYLRRLGVFPHLTNDAITDSLKQLQVDHNVGDFLRPAEIRALLDAAEKHDAQTFKGTRAEHALGHGVGTTPRYQPILPLIRAALLTGMRIGELVSLDWSQVDLDAQVIRLTAATKTRRGRVVGLEVCPSLVGMLKDLGPAKSGSVFGMTGDQVKAAVRRLADYDAPDGWTWNTLRRTCGTFLTCAPGIYGAGSAYRSARRLGHSVAVAEKHYVGVVRGIPADATTLEVAMGLKG